MADNGNGGYQTAAVWSNKDYGNELTFGADYGAYTDCDATGLAKPGDKVVDVLTWAFYRSFQEAINEGNSSLLRYSTAGNSTRCAAEIRNYTGNTYDLGNFQAVSDRPPSNTPMARSSTTATLLPTTRTAAAATQRTITARCALCGRTASGRWTPFRCCPTARTAPPPTRPCRNHPIEGTHEKYEVETCGGVAGPAAGGLRRIGHGGTAADARRSLGPHGGPGSDRSPRRHAGADPAREL
ncbi:MAG: hypothetical protein ACLUFT_11620 [Gemmiger formicilis]|uniref:hypothetical protein n=1 Tax=Gemmiger formicilis TaxID=745368 RepID=UPI003993E3AF